MANIFISYNRQNEATIKSLVNAIEALGHTVWFDKKIYGGQVWWSRILEEIRTCDVFIFVIDPQSLKSTACKREYSYAADIGKVILPVQISDEISRNFLPPVLSNLEIVVYRSHDRDTAFVLAKAITNYPPPFPLPDPLPPPPDIPITKLGALCEKIEAESLSFEEQSLLIVNLKTCMRNPENSSDALSLIEQLSRRPDLYAAIATEIDSLLSHSFITTSLQNNSKNTASPKDSSLFHKKEELSTRSTPQTIFLHERIVGALFWGGGGAIFFILIAYISIQDETGLIEIGARELFFGLLFTAIGSLVGVFCGVNKKTTVITISGVVLGAIAGVFIFGDLILILAVFFGSIIGAIVAVPIGVYLEKKSKKPI